MKKIYVGNIPYSATEEALGNVFKPFGEVTSVRVAQDSRSGRSKGFAFVEMADQGADQAIAALDGTEFEGRTLRVAEARERTDAPRERGGYDRDRGDRGDRGNRRPGGGYGGGGGGRGGQRRQHRGGGQNY